MGAKIGFLFFLLSSSFYMLQQAAEARIPLNYNYKSQQNDTLISQLNSCLLTQHLTIHWHKTSQMRKTAIPPARETFIYEFVSDIVSRIFFIQITNGLSSVKLIGTCIYHVHLATQQQAAAGAYRSIPAIKLAEVEDGGFVAPPPLSSPKQSPLKAVVVIILLGLTSSVATGLIRKFCIGGQHVGPVRPNVEESEPRPISVGGHHVELTICRCDNVSLFTSAG